MPEQTRPSQWAPPSCDDRVVWDIWMSVYHFPTLVAADELGLFSLLEAGPATAEDVARRLALGPRAIEAMLGVLAALGLLAHYQGKFSLTGASRNFLLPNKPYYWGGMLRFIQDIRVTHATIREALRNDLPIDCNEYPDGERVDNRTLDEVARETRAMHSHSFPAAMGLARHDDFKAVRHLLDVGGGSGCFCIALALHHTDIRCTVLDLPLVCLLAEQYAAEFGVNDRVRTYAANMFVDPWPDDCDAVFMSNILHDWDSERCTQLARRSFNNLPSGGRIYLHEILLADTKDGPLAATSFSMAMFTFNSGKQFTGGELEGLLTGAGFVNVTISAVYGYFSLVSANKP